MPLIELDQEDLNDYLARKLYSIEKVRKAIKAGANVKDAKSSSLYHQGATLLITLIKDESIPKPVKLKVAEELINAGIDVNAAENSYNGRTSAIMYATRYGQNKIVRLLIKSGADVQENFIDPDYNNDTTVFQYAVSRYVNGRSSEKSAMMDIISALIETGKIPNDQILDAIKKSPEAIPIEAKKQAARSLIKQA